MIYWWNGNLAISITFILSQLIRRFPIVMLMQLLEIITPVIYIILRIQLSTNCTNMWSTHAALHEWHYWTYMYTVHLQLTLCPHSFRFAIINWNTEKPHYHITCTNATKTILLIQSENLINRAQLKCDQLIVFMSSLTCELHHWIALSQLLYPQLWCAIDGTGNPHHHLHEFVWDFL